MYIFHCCQNIEAHLQFSLALLNGDLDSGISIMQMTRGLDEGPIYSAEKITIPENADKHILETELTKVANKVLFTTLLESIKK